VVASRTVLNGDGSITVTKLTGMAVLGAAGATIINSLFSSDAWNNVTLLQERLRNQKRIYHEVYFWVIVTVIYILANWLIWLFTHAWHSGASDIAGNGIMFASNDRVGAAAAGV
jgi:APA family basic amino acid/polyamine antiporter